MADETGKTGKDNLPGTGQPPPGGSGTPPKAPKETFTRAEHEKDINDVKREEGRKRAEAERQRDAKAAALTEAEGKLATMSTTLEQLQDRVDGLEHQGLGDTPEGVKALRVLNEAKELQKKNIKERDDLTKERATHAEEVRLAQETRLETTIWEIAGEFKANPEKLKELCLEFKLTTEEQIRKQAEAIAGSGTSAQGADAGKKAGATAGFHPDSTKGAGGREDLSGLSADDHIKRGLEEARKK